MSAPSTLVTRYGIPVAIAWSGLVLSSFVFSRVAETTQIDPVRGSLTFLGVPAISFLGFIVLRLARRRVGAEAGRGEDVVVAWVMTFLLGMHCVVLGLALRLIESVQHAVPLAVGLLVVGLGPVLGTLEYKSAMGVRTKATLASPKAWAKTHRLIGFAFPIAGIAGFCGFWVPGVLGLAVSLLPPVIALAVVIGYAATLPIVDEQPVEEDRPNDDGDAQSP
jgi:uncharacterized membrane protein